MNRAQKGFTLAELLIALALLGVIAAFTIPKVLQAAGDQEKQAKLRETVATLESAWYNKRMQPDTWSAGTLFSVISPSLNTVKSHATNSAITDGILPTGHPCGTAPAVATGYIVFSNGVVVTGLNSGDPTVSPSVEETPAMTQLCIDVNGLNGPNTHNSDVYGTFRQAHATNTPRGFTAWGDTDTANNAWGLGVSTGEGKSFYWDNETNNLIGKK